MRLRNFVRDEYDLIWSLQTGRVEVGPRWRTKVFKRWRLEFLIVGWGEGEEEHRFRVAEGSSVVIFWVEEDRGSSKGDGMLGGVETSFGLTGKFNEMCSYI